MGVHGLVAQNTTTAQYIETYKSIAMQEMRLNGIPASITLAQGILESASGNSKLAKDCNNHFGIKCRKNWTSKYCLADDDAPNECFRGYETAEESYRDHSLFLKENSRYATLFTHTVTDYSSWANGLRTAGYATNPAYGSSLIAVIEKHQLARFDSMVVLGADYTPPVSSVVTVAQEINGLPIIVAKEGQTSESIATENAMGAWQIYKYNDLKRGEKIQPGEIVYLKPKKRRADIPVHLVKDGETIRSISQLHGIKMKHIYKKNDLKPGQQVKPGDVLYLQKKKSVESNQKTATIDSAQSKPDLVKDETKIRINQSVDEPVAGIHTVKQGETLYSIARINRVTVEDLMEWNGLNSNTIKVDQKLYLTKPSELSNEDTDNSKTEKTVNPVKKQSVYHAVKKGETLYQIAKKHGTTVDFLKKLNNLRNDTIQTGQRILVKTD
jgi:LysM repeat protein